MRKRWLIAFLVAAIGISQVTVPQAGATVISIGENSAARQEVTELSVVEEEVFTGTVTQKTTDTADDAAEFLKEKKGSFDVKYKFTLEVVSYVTIESVCKMFSYNFVGDWSLYLGTAEGSMDFKLGSEWALENETLNYQMALEAGTYWLTLRINREGTAGSTGSIVDSHFISIGVNAQPMVERTGGASGKSTLEAIPMVNGETSWGCITGVTKDGIFTNAVQQQVFSFTLPKATSVNLKRVVSRPIGLDAGMSDTKNSLVVIAEDGSIVLNTTKATENVMENTLELETGTYFVAVSYPRFCEVSVRADWEEPVVVVKKIKKLTVKAKAKTRVVTGNTQALAKVTVEVGGKKYAKKSTNKGVYKVQVPKLKSGMVLTVSASKDGYKTKSKVVVVD